MVGVPGKYKGCETCRRRRVKCTNERPFCQKCINSGRDCEGYERERVFITGTVANKGRVASHPKKAGSLSTTGSSPGRETLETSTPSSSGLNSPEGTPERQSSAARCSTSGFTYSAVRPYAAAWDDYITLRNPQGHDSYAFLTALPAPAQGFSSNFQNSTRGDGIKVSLTPYKPITIPSIVGSNIVDTGGRCLVNAPSSDGVPTPSDSYCAFLFENTTTPEPHASNYGFAQGPVAPAVQQMGSQAFTSFPNHHYFARVYRPMTISTALLNRKSIFLAEVDWTTTPWFKHPKTAFDQLLDMIAYLPSLLEQTDLIASLEATTSRNQQAQGILQNCIALEVRFNHWLQVAGQINQGTSLSYWPEEIVEPPRGLPFSHSYNFCDGTTGIMYLYYWMALIPFHRCIESLYSIVFQPVIDVYPNIWMEVPAHLHLEDPTRYTQTRDLATNICRGLDAALAASTQPDILVAPMTVALDYYREMGSTSQDGVLEILWLEAFKGRLVEKGQHVATVLEQNNWLEIARY